MSSTNGNTQKNIVKLLSLDSKIQNLLREAVQAREFAYAPYSKFPVGAALLCDDGVVYPGCNVENMSFTVGTCAERCAIFKAVSEGRRKYKAIAVIGYQERFYTMPCGACRQMMSEFGNMDVYIGKPDLRDVFVTTLEELMPNQFQTVDHEFS
ncbi:unnamed protein product [Brassicogethes aeneus]|uniref:Cytidine deaminase n=1 Tax=Brassicogethes aeneus TaxID=1431903 RepID=A0A9P0BHR4_BRAAE|nr:unnamed protein product [Brassicogethes aeneus]